MILTNHFANITSISLHLSEWQICLQWLTTQPIYKLIRSTRLARQPLSDCSILTRLIWDHLKLNYNKINYKKIFYDKRIYKDKFAFKWMKQIWPTEKFINIVQSYLVVIKQQLSSYQQLQAQAHTNTRWHTYTHDKDDTCDKDDNLNCLEWIFFNSFAKNNNNLLVFSALYNLLCCLCFSCFSVVWLLVITIVWAGTIQELIIPNRM